MKEEVMDLLRRDINHAYLFENLHAEDTLLDFLAKWWMKCPIKCKGGADEESALLEEILDSKEMQDYWDCFQGFASNSCQSN
jgi:hypothetical protein